MGQTKSQLTEEELQDYEVNILHNNVYEISSFSPITF